MSNEARDRNAFALLFTDMVTNIMARAASPGKCCDYIASQIRELLAVRTVVVIECTHFSGEASHKLLAVFPERRRALALRPEMDALAELSHNVKKTTHVRSNSPATAGSDLLRSFEVEDAVVVPLQHADMRVGVILLLGVMDPSGIDTIINTLDRLAPILALILRNAHLFNNLEQEVAARTVALKESEERHRALFSSVSDPVLVAGRNTGILIECNKAAEIFFGKTREQLIGMPQKELHPPGTPCINGLTDDFRQAVAEPGIQVIVPLCAANREVRTAAVQTSTFAIGEQELILGVFRDVTEQLQAELEIKEKELGLRLALDSTKSGMWQWDIATGKNTWTDKLWNLYMIQRDNREPSYELWRESIHPDDRSQVEDVVLAASKSSSAFEIEWRTDSSDGQVVWLMSRGTPQFDADGQVVRYLGIVTDITQRKELETKIRESEQHFRTLANSGQALIWTSTPDKLCNYFNEIWLAFTGRTLEQELGNGWAEGVHPDDLQRCLDIYTTAFDRRERFSMEYRLRHNSGEYRWILDPGTPRYDTRGEFMGYIGHCLDITETMMAEDALKQSEKRFRSLFNEMTIGLALHEIICDEKGLPADYRFLEINPAFESLTGLRGADILGRTVLESIPETEPLWIETYGQVALTGVPVEFEEYSKSLDRWYEIKAYSPSPGKFAVIFKDTSSNKRAEAAQLAAKIAAEAANLAKSEFLANMSHEIRTPLNGMLGMLQLLSMGCGADDRQGYVTMAQQAGQRLLNLLNDILDFSKIEAGQMVHRQEPFSPKAILDDVGDLFRVQATEKSLGLDIRLDQSVPSMLIGDAARLRQVLFNLVGNSIKFTPTGSVTIEAWSNPSRRHPGKTCLHVSVCDTGVGIPDDKIEHVFQRFTQTDASYTRSYQGAGLGLAIVKRIMDLMGGDIVVDSEVGVGTKMHVTLLLDTPKQTLETSTQRKTVIQIRPLHILLAEDEPINRLSMQVLLERMGHSVVCAEDGSEAIKALVASDFDCILMDVQMPVMDGVKATQVIRGMSELGGKSRIPIIALTAYTMEGDRETFLAAGMNDHVPKPVQQADLERALCQQAG